MKKEEGKKYTGHKIKKVLPSSIAMEVGIEAGDWILTVNGKEIQDNLTFGTAVWGSLSEKIYS